MMSREWPFAWFCVLLEHTAPLIVWVTHYNVCSLPSVAYVSVLCLNSIHLGISLDAQRVHSRPPSVTLSAGGLKFNSNKTKTHSAI